MTVFQRLEITFKARSAGSIGSSLDRAGHGHFLVSSGQMSV
ncbi:MULTISPECIES: hypothetical protein [unclassified Mesorhizobium]